MKKKAILKIPPIPTEYSERGKRTAYRQEWWI